MTEKFIIDGMSCSACSSAVEKAVTRVNGVTAASVNLLGKSMLCEYDAAQTNSQSIISAVEKAGFSAYLHKDKEKIPTSVSAAYTPVKTRLIVSVSFLIPLMYISMGHMVGLPLPEIMHGEKNALIFAFSQFLLSLPIIYVNRKFYFSGFKAFIRRSPDMDTLVAIGSSAALIYGIFSIFMIGYSLGHSDYKLCGTYASKLYFESASMILTLVTVGKYFEERSKDKTNSAIAALMYLTPETATVIREDKEILVYAADIFAGDIISVKPGERIPVDGVIIQGDAAIDESALTGESIPVEKHIGSNVLSATVNTNGAFLMKAVNVGKDTTLSKIIELVENAGASKAPVARMADKIAAVFVPVVITIAVLTCTAWLIAGESFEFALSSLISVLVISCPCALGLATPVAITVAAGVCASNGILIKSAQALELLGKCTVAVLDKTGTVTKGVPEVTDIIPCGIEKHALLEIAASLEKSSEHPLAQAITSIAQSSYDTSGFKAIPGKGVMAVINETRYYGGNEKYMTDLGVDLSSHKETAENLSSDGKTIMFFSCESTLCGMIAAADAPRETSAEAINLLKSLGVNVILLTGDNEQCARAIAAKAGIKNVISNVLPRDKENEIAKLQNNESKVIMVGDGINDSPALTRADIGIAIGSGTDVAIESADIVLLKNDLRDVAKAISFSRRTIRNIKQNLFWAFFYNVIGIPVAAGVLYPSSGITLSPMIGAATMSLSSLFVVSNALRLYKTERKK